MSYRPKSPEAEVILDANKLTEIGCGEATTVLLTGVSDRFAPV
jgi:hypothetical protein